MPTLMKPAAQNRFATTSLSSQSMSEQYTTSRSLFGKSGNRVIFLPPPIERGTETALPICAVRYAAAGLASTNRTTPTATISRILDQFISIRVQDAAEASRLLLANDLLDLLLVEAIMMTIAHNNPNSKISRLRKPINSIEKRVLSCRYRYFIELELRKS